MVWFVFVFIENTRKDVRLVYLDPLFVLFALLRSVFRVILIPCDDLEGENIPLLTQFLIFYGKRQDILILSIIFSVLLSTLPRTHLIYSHVGKYTTCRFKPNLVRMGCPLRPRLADRGLDDSVGIECLPSPTQLLTALILVLYELSTN